MVEAEIVVFWVSHFESSLLVLPSVGAIGVQRESREQRHKRKLEGEGRCFTVSKSTSTTIEYGTPTTKAGASKWDTRRDMKNFLLDDYGSQITAGIIFLLLKRQQAKFSFSLIPSRGPQT